eukprot:2176442-Alexandrium_andersonii.AAC.1
MSASLVGSEMCIRDRAYDDADNEFWELGRLVGQAAPVASATGAAAGQVAALQCAMAWSVGRAIWLEEAAVDLHRIHQG